MPAVLTEKKNPAAKYESAVDEQIAQATSRIRVHDLAFGGLLLFAMVLVYATAMILLDRYLVLPEWVRQLALFGLLAAAGATAYWAIVRPLRRRVNPLYAAVQVEKTIEDAKNSVAGYVEAQEKGDVHPAVRAAMSARAAKSVDRADVNRAVDHRSLLYTGAVAVVFILMLVLLFFVFRPAQFASLVGRTFAPFSADPIANRTQLALLEPTDGDVTITAGQSVTVKVHVSGKSPSPDRPDRVRVLLRHTQAAAEFEEIAMEKGESSHEWQARVPDYLVRNGFWYKVAGGDAETSEYRVSVRSLPIFTEYEVSYDYPAYTRRKPEPPTASPHIEAYRGTKVTMTARTNRVVKDGRMTFEPPGRDPVFGKLPADRPDSLQFQFYLTASGTYKLHFTSTEGERNADSNSFTMKVIEDEAPKVDVVKPEEDEVTIPANGQLAIDGRIGDDFGIDKVTLKLRLLGQIPRPLADRPYHDGKSFRRDKDGTWPTTLEYKDSVDLARLKDAAGQKVELKEGMIVEFWLEATDNRTRPGPTGPEPDPNVGRSRVKKVQIAPPVNPEQQEKLDARKQERQAEEAKHDQAQQQRLDNEQRNPPDQKPNPGQPQQPPEGTQDPNQQPPGANPNPPPMNPMGMPDPGMTKPPGKTEPKTAQEPKTDPDQPPMNPMKGMGDPMMPPPAGMPMSEPGNNGMGEQNPMAPPPADAGRNRKQNETQDQAKRVEDELKKGAEGGGAPKSGPPKEGERTNAGEAKPPTPGGMEPTDPPKEGPKPSDPANPMNAGASAESKPAGKQEKPEAPADPKPEPDMMGQPGATPQPDQKNKNPGEAAGTDKETPKPQQPDGPQEGAGGGATKPATEQKTQPGNPTENAAKPKPMPKNDPGMDKEPAGNPMGGAQSDTTQKPQGGAAKPQTMPEPAGTKPTPKEADPMASGPASEPKPAPQDGGTGNPMSPKAGSPDIKPDKSTTPMGAGNPGGSPDKSMDKPKPDQQPVGGGQGEQGPKGSGGEQRKLDPKEEKELKNALNDLTSKDEQKRKAAQDKLDQMMGRQNRKDIEDIAKGLKSDNKQERDAAEKKLNDLKDQMQKAGQEPKKGGNPAQPSKPDPKEVDKALQDLKSPDQQTRDAAKEKLDKMLGKGTGQKAEEDTQNLQSDNKQEREAAQDRLNDLKNKANDMAKAGGTEPKKGANENATGGTPKVDPKEAEKALNDLGDPDPKKRDAAKAKLDEMFGKGAGQKAEDLKNDLQSDNKQTREAAQQKLNDLKKEAEKRAQSGAGEPKKDQTDAGRKVDPKEVEKALEDLNDADPKKRDAAKAKLDEMLGKGAGQKAEEMNKKLNSGNLDEEGRARRERDEMLKKAEEMAKKGQNPPQGKQPTPEEIDDLTKKAGDLNSKDEAKRKAAEKELDQKLGEENRKKLQEAMKNQSGPSEQQAEEMRKQLEQMAKNPTGAGSNKPDGNRIPKGPPGSQDTKLKEAMKEDARNRAKSAELQLETFEKNKDNKDLLDRLGWDRDKYGKFLKLWQEEVARLKQEADEAEKALAGPAPTGPPPANVSGGSKVESRNEASGSATGSGAVFAAPGLTGAMKNFQDGAARLQGGKKQP
ncbi:MAG: hypothetical protein JWO38_233 [Gemmataceae bacterium]|nr:hypothetical protein [Gemmataceae bacterium]